MSPRGSSISFMCRGRSFVVVEFGSKPLRRPPHPRQRGAKGNVHPDGNLFKGQVIIDAEPDHAAIVRGQVFDASPQPTPRLGFDHRRDRVLLGVLDGDLLGHHFATDRLATPMKRRMVGRHSEQPGPPRYRGDRSTVFFHRQINRLQTIVDVAGLGQSSAQKTPQPAFDADENFPKFASPVLVVRVFQRWQRLVRCRIIGRRWCRHHGVPIARCAHGDDYFRLIYFRIIVTNARAAGAVRSICQRRDRSGRRSGHRSGRRFGPLIGAPLASRVAPGPALLSPLRQFARPESPITMPGASLTDVLCQTRSSEGQSNESTNRIGTVFDGRQRTYHRPSR